MSIYKLTILIGVFLLLIGGWLTLMSKENLFRALGYTLCAISIIGLIINANLQNKKLGYSSHEEEKNSLIPKSLIGRLSYVLGLAALTLTYFLLRNMGAQ